MRRAVVLVAILAAALPPLAAASPRPPSLTLVAGKPLVVRGAHFRPLEAVRVTASANGTTALVRVRATRAGTFVATADVPFGRCGNVRVVAVGGRGSRAAAHLPLPACLPARHP